MQQQGVLILVIEDGEGMERTLYAWPRAHGRMHMHNVHVCMYACTCIRFTLHSELQAYPSYGHPP